MTTHANAVRKHAQPFVATLRKVGADLNDFEPHRLPWQDLCKVERDAKATAKQIIGSVTDATAEARAAEIEAAFDALTAIAEDCAADKDARNERGDRGPWAGIDLSKRPMFENGSSSAVDGGDVQQPDEAFALRSGDRMTTWAEARRPDADMRGLSTGRYLRAMLTGAETDLERRALAEGSDSSGGFTVPSILSARLIDALRAQSVVNRAGAQIVPLTSDYQSIAAVASDPVPAWRVENAAIAESDPTFRSVEFQPKSLAVMVRVSRELFEDSVNVATALPDILTSAMAIELDRVALLGSGTAPEPRGIANTSGIGTTAHDSALTGFGPLVTARTGILSANAGPVSAFIAHPRDEGRLTGLTASDGQPLNAPGAIGAIPMLTTTAIPTDGGAGSDESQIIAGNFAHLMIGMRSEIRVEILRERFASDHQFGMIAHLRADIAVQHAAAFHTITGVQG